MPDTAYFESKQMYNTIRQYSEQIKRINNQLHSLRILPVQNKEIIKSLEKMKVFFEKESNRKKSNGHVDHLYPGF